MATWTAPKTWSNAAVTAAEFNTHIRDNETWLKGAFTQLNVLSDSAKAKITPALVGARVTKAALQTITTGVSTAITYDSETGGFDSDAFHDTATNNTRITIPASMDGYYVCGATIEWVANATGNRRLSLSLNGVTSLVMDTRAGFATQACHISVAVLYQFAAADYIETAVFQTSGGNLDVSASSLSPWMWIHRMSST